PEAGYSETPPRKQRRGGVRWLRWWWAPIVVVGVASNAFSSDSIPRDSSGAIVSSAQMSVHDLRVGDCFDFVDAQEEEGVYEIDAVMGKNCSLLHDHEVYVVEALDMDEGYPSEFRFERIFEDVCIGAFASYVGTEWEFSDVWAD